ELPPLKRRVTFFCPERQKSHGISFGQKSPKKNALPVFRIKSHSENDADAGMRHTGHPALGDARRTSMCAALRVSYRIASYLRRPAIAEQKQSNGNDND
ncbi:MAG: hypothetical protein ACREP7_13135, partial [Lysobacter sp.]